MSKKETGGQAFPLCVQSPPYHVDNGMTLRDYAILHGPWTIKDIKGSFKVELSPEELSERVVLRNNIYADYFIKERSNE